LQFRWRQAQHDIGFIVAAASSVWQNASRVKSSGGKCGVSSGMNARRLAVRMLETTESAWLNSPMNDILVVLFPKNARCEIFKKSKMNVITQTLNVIVLGNSF
jgi:hypothetical protein